MNINATGHASTSRVVPHIVFTRPIPILGTSKRVDQFTAAEGWVIEVHDYGVTLSHPGAQNVPAVPAFCTCGVGYSVPEAKPLEEETVTLLALPEPSAEAKALAQRQRKR